MESHSSYSDNEAPLDDLVRQRITQIADGIVVVMQFVETLAENGEQVPEGMYHFLWTKLEKVNAVIRYIDNGEEVSDDLDHTPL